MNQEHSVRQHLRLEIDAYDATIRRWIPGYSRMLEEAARAVAEVAPGLALDLGAGTGALSEAILQHASVEQVELIDVDPEMLDQARGRLSEYCEEGGSHAGSKVRFSLRSFDTPFPECGAIAASLALHHIPSLEQKQALFARAFAALRPGGVLVNADCTMPGTATPEAEREQQRLYQYWADHQVDQGIVEADAWRHFEEWSEEDTYLPLEEELAALRTAGFTADRVWNAGPIGVVVARKPSRVSAAQPGADPAR